MRRILFAALLALLQGCAVEPAQSPANGARPPELTPIEATGPYRHEPSHAIVPDEYAGFRRVSLFRRGADGQRLTVSYAGGTPQCLTAITMFLDPADPGTTLDKAYANAKAEVMHAYPAAVLEHEDSRDDPALAGKRAFFLIDDKRMEVAVTASRKDWFVKHRIVYPGHCRETVRDQVNAFFPGWPR